MKAGHELAIERLRARRHPRGGDDGDSSTESVSKLKRDCEEFKRTHALPPLPSGAADAASKRQHVAPSVSPGRPAAATPARPPPYELLVESPDGDVQSYPVDSALPLRDTLLCHELSPGSHLRLNGGRLDTTQSASYLGLARGAVLQAFAPQTGGGYEEGNNFETDREAEGEMEAEQPRRRQRVAAESEDGEPSAGEAEGREEQEGAAGDEAMGSASDGDVPMAAPTSFECPLCYSVKPMESAVKGDGCDHPDLVCGSCMFTVIYGHAAECPQCRAPASALVQVATGRRYPVTDTTLSRVDTQGGALAEPGDRDACHTCHKRGLLFECEGDGCGQNRCFQCSGLDWPPEESEPFFCETCTEARGAATPRPPDASATQSDAGGVAMAESATRRRRQRVTAAPEGDESEGDELEDEADAADEAEGQDATAADEQQARQAQQARQTQAQAASARAAKFQAQQRDRVHAPAIAESGMRPWGGVSVEVAQLDESKVRDAPAAHHSHAHHATATKHHRHRCRCPTLARGSRPRSRRCGPRAPGRHRCCPRRPTRC